MSHSYGRSPAPVQVAAASQPANGAAAAAPVRRRRKPGGAATAVAGSSDIFVKATTVGGVTTRWCHSSLAKLVNIASISLWLMVDISLLLGFIKKLITEHHLAGAAVIT